MAIINICITIPDDATNKFIVAGAITEASRMALAHVVGNGAPAVDEEVTLYMNQGHSATIFRTE